MNWKVYKDEIIIAFIVVAGFAIGCSKSIVIERNERLEPKVETYAPRTKSDTTETTDTTREPITFSVSVEGWEEIIINP